MPLNEYYDYDLKNFSKVQLKAFYYDNPEALPDAEDDNI
jgi:hypothetical protein